MGFTAVQVDSRPVSTRRQRREAVEAGLLAGIGTMKLVAQLAQRFSCSPRTVFVDLRLIQSRWAREDTRHAQARRGRVLRRLERLVNKAETEGNLAVAHAALATLARCTGLISPDSRTTNVAVLGADTLAALVQRCGVEEIKPAVLAEPAALPTKVDP